MKRLAIVTTHPIQYQSPWIQMLSENGRIEVKVFYTWGRQGKDEKFDPGFGKSIVWDIPLLEGYEYQFVENVAKKPGSHHYAGINNPGLIDQILEWNADAVLVNGWKFKSHLKCIRFFHKKIPVLFRGDSTLLDVEQGVRGKIRKMVLRRVFKNVDFAFYTGSENKKYFQEYGLHEEQLIFTPHAIDNQRFSRDTAKEKAKQIRTALGIKEDEFVFLFAGKFEKKKNPELLLKAFRNLENQNCHLIVLGSGKLEEHLKRSCGDGRRIHFLPFQNQKAMPGYYAASDAFVLPSSGPGETWGLAVNEAMACSRPVIVSGRCGCARDLVTPENGFVFQAGNEADLLSKMADLMQSDVRKMGSCSRKIIEDWSFERVAQSIENLVERL